MPNVSSCQKLKKDVYIVFKNVLKSSSVVIKTSYVTCHKCYKFSSRQKGQVIKLPWISPKTLGVVFGKVIQILVHWAEKVDMPHTLLFT